MKKGIIVAGAVLMGALAFNTTKSEAKIVNGYKTKLTSAQKKKYNKIVPKYAKVKYCARHDHVYFDYSYKKLKKYKLYQSNIDITKVNGKKFKNTAGFANYDTGKCKCNRKDTLIANFDPVQKTVLKAGKNKINYSIYIDIGGKTDRWFIYKGTKTINIKKKILHKYENEISEITSSASDPSAYYYAFIGADYGRSIGTIKGVSLKDCPIGLWRQTNFSGDVKFEFKFDLLDLPSDKALIKMQDSYEYISSTNVPFEERTVEKMKSIIKSRKKKLISLIESGKYPRYYTFTWNTKIKANKRTRFNAVMKKLDPEKYAQIEACMREAGFDDPKDSSWEFSFGLNTRHAFTSMYSPVIKMTVSSGKTVDTLTTVANYDKILFTNRFNTFIDPKIMVGGTSDDKEYYTQVTVNC